MSWTTPFTSTVGMVLTEVKMNARRDNLVRVGVHEHSGDAGDGAGMTLDPILMRVFTPHRSDAV